MICHQSSWDIFKGFILFFLFSVTNSSRISLTGDDWFISNGQTLEATGRVPGTIHTILYSAKLIDDPYWRFGDTNLRYLIYQSWTFTKRFSLEDDFLNLTQFILHFDQIDTVSNITLNECYLGNTISMFFAYKFNVRRNCISNDNILRVQFMSPVIYALDQSIAYIKPVHPNCTNPIQHGECHVQFIRKEPCSFSWDWVSYKYLVFQIQYESSKFHLFVICFRVQHSLLLVFQEMYISME
jgi:beta-mannosidase